MSRGVAVCVVLAGLLAGWDAEAQTLNEKRRLLRGVVRIDVPGREETGTGIIVAVEGRRAYIVTALHVVVGPPEVAVVARSRGHDPRFSARPASPTLRTGGTGRSATG